MSCSQATAAAVAVEAGYPSPGSYPSSRLDKLLDLPNGGRMDARWFRERVWAEADSVDVPPDRVIPGRQAVIFVVLKNGDGSESRTLVGKRILPSELPPKANAQMWADFGASAQREIQFYRDLLASAKEDSNGDGIGDLFPACHYSDSNSVGPDEVLGSGFYFLLLDDVSARFFQRDSLDRGQTEALMRALAKFHAHFWRSDWAEEKEAARVAEAEEDERGGFWTLKRRKPLGELESASSTWSALLERLPELKGAPDVQQLVLKLVSHAPSLDSFVSRHSGVTRIHGDCKAWNLFLGKEDKDDVLLIDMQWTGRGHPMQDVAYALTTSLNADILPEMDHFVDLYCDELKKRLGEAASAEVDLLRSHYDLVWLDYVRVIVTGLWKNLSHEQMQRYQDVVGPSMINKSLPHVQFILRRLHQKLELEDVCAALTKRPSS